MVVVVTATEENKTSGIVEWAYATLKQYLHKIKKWGIIPPVYHKTFKIMLFYFNFFKKN